MEKKLINGNWFRRDHQRGNFGNFVDGTGPAEEYHVDLSDLLGLNDEADEGYDDIICTKSMALHTHGELDVREDPGMVSGTMNLVPMVNCFMQVDDQEYLGFHLSLATEFEFTASR